MESGKLSLDRDLLATLLRENPFQPATGIWRAVEVGFVGRHGLPPGRGIDIGSGDGRLMSVLLDLIGEDQKRSIVGVDLDALEVAAARRVGVYRAVHVASADSIPEPDASFDWAFSNSTLEHIEPIEGTLSEVARVLRSGGTFIFTVPSHEFHACLRGPFAGSRQRYLEAVDERCAHLRYWDEERWESELQRVGMKLVSAEGYLSVAETRRWEFVSGITAGLLHRLTRQPPIRVQRRLGMRRGQRIPTWGASFLARTLTLGLGGSSSRRQGCRYFVAERI